jgi:hypothetical protein
MNVLLEAFFGELLMSFGVIVNVGKGSAFFGVDIVFFSVI